MLAILVIPALLAADNQLPILANSRVEEKTLSKHEVVDIFMGRVARWADHVPVVVVIYPYESFSHRLFLRTYLGIGYFTYERRMDASQSNSISPNFKSPLVVDNGLEMLQVLRKTRGSIGYFNGRIYLHSRDGVKRLDIKK